MNFTTEAQKNREGLSTNQATNWLPPQREKLIAADVIPRTRLEVLRKNEQSNPIALIVKPKLETSSRVT